MRNLGLFGALVLGSATFAPSAAVADPVIELSASRCADQGRRLGPNERAAPADLAQDAFCVDLLFKSRAPEGAVVVFGSSRAAEGDASYELVRSFARAWTTSGSKLPIASGGGGGLMEAAARGAVEGRGQSIAVMTYFGSDPWRKKLNPYVLSENAYVCSSFSQREAELVDRGTAIVIALGGVGTEWEIFETLTKLQTGKKAPAPVILLGSASDWESLHTRLDAMAAQGAVTPADLKLFEHAETAEAAVQALKRALGSK